MSFICVRMKNDFHIKGWAITLVLKQRRGGTRKWPDPEKTTTTTKKKLCGLLIARENRPHFATPLTVSPRNWLLGNERRNSEPLTCHYSDLVSVSDWLKQISRAARPINQKHYQDLGSDASSAWNFCSRSSDVISWGNQWWHREMSAVFSALFLMCHRVAISPSQTLHKRPRMCDDTYAR